MNKVCVYTCFNEKYDNFSKCKVYAPDKHVDYLAFTDATKNIDDWQIIPTEFDGSNNRLITKKKKILEDAIELSKYDFTVWIDGRINLMSPILPLVESMMSKNYDIMVFNHPFSWCREKFRTFGDECHQLRRLHYLPVDIVDDMYYIYTKAGIKYEDECVMGGVVIRRHNENTTLFNQLWFQESLKWSSNDIIRDQPGLIYALYNSPVNYYINRVKFKKLNTVIRCKYFQIGKHNDGKNF